MSLIVEQGPRPEAGTAGGRSADLHTAGSRSGDPPAAARGASVSVVSREEVEATYLPSGDSVVDVRDARSGGLVSETPVDGVLAYPYAVMSKSIVVLVIYNSGPGARLEWHSVSTGATLGTKSLRMQPYAVDVASRVIMYQPKRREIRLLLGGSSASRRIFRSDREIDAAQIEGRRVFWLQTWLKHANIFELKLR